MVVLVFVVLVASFSYGVRRLRRGRADIAMPGRRAVAGAAPATTPPTAGLESLSWTALDDRQLTRLLENESP